MSQPWLPEREVSAELAQALIEAQFPALAPVRVVFLGVGWDNVAYRVNDGCTFRFPQRQVGADLLENERNLLPLVAPAVTLPAPLPLFFGQPTAAHPWPFLGYPYLAGRTACSANLDDEQRSRLAAPLGRFIASLHAVSVEEARRRGAGPDPFGRFDFAKRGPVIRQRLEQLAAQGEIPAVQPWAAIIERAVAPTAPVVLVHGDLYERHLLVDEAGALTGVIDWGDLHLGDPAVDLALAHTFLPPTAHLEFRAAYGPVHAASWQLARFRALDYACIFLLTGQERDDAPFIALGRRVLQYLAA